MKDSRKHRFGWSKFLKILKKLFEKSFLRATPKTFENFCHKRKETIERLFGTAKEFHGFRYTNIIGQARMEMKVELTFACLNLKNLAIILWKKRRNHDDHSMMLPLFTFFSDFWMVLLNLKNKAELRGCLNSALSSVWAFPFGKDFIISLLKTLYICFFRFRNRFYFCYRYRMPRRYYFPWFRFLPPKRPLFLPRREPQ